MGEYKGISAGKEWAEQLLPQSSNSWIAFPQFSFLLTLFLSVSLSLSFFFLSPFRSSFLPFIFLSPPTKLPVFILLLLLPLPVPLPGSFLLKTEEPGALTMQGKSSTTKLH